MSRLCFSAFPSIAEAVTIWKTGEVEMIHKPGVGHHPHSLENPAPIVAFLEKHCLPSRG